MPGRAAVDFMFCFAPTYHGYSISAQSYEFNPQLAMYHIQHIANGWIYMYIVFIKQGSVHYGVNTVKSTLHIYKTVYTVRKTAHVTFYIIEQTVYSVQCTVYSVQCSVEESVDA